MAQNNQPGTVKDIDIRLFYSGRGRGDGWATKLIKSLEVDKPVELTPHIPSGTKADSAASSLSQAAKREGVKVAIRELDGVRYVMRLRQDTEVATS